MTADPSTGPYFIARLLAGLPVAPLDLQNLSAPWDFLANLLSEAPVERRQAALDLALSLLKADHGLRAAISAYSVGSSNPGSCNSGAEQPNLPPPAEDAGVPELPPQAQLDPGAGALTSGSWVSEYLTFAAQAAPMSDPAFHLSCALFLLSTAVARRVHIQAGAGRLYPNLYQLIIAPSTLHHKTTALHLAGHVLQASGVEVMLLPPRQTPESLVFEMGTVHPQTYSAWSRSEQAHWLSERAFAAQRGWLIDEASQLLESFNRDYTAGLLPLVLSLYDCPEREASQTIGRGRQTIQNGYLTLLGATTPAALAQHLQRSAHWSNGLWARFALVSPDQEVPGWQFLPQQIQPPPDLASRLNQLAFQSLGVPQVQETSDRAMVDALPEVTALLPVEVYAAWERYARALSYDLLISGQIDSRLWPSYGRLHIAAMKVALLLAVSDWNDQGGSPLPLEIGLRHWSQAQAIAESWRLSAHRVLGDASRGEERSREERVLRALSNSGPAGFTAREIYQRVHLPRAAVNDVLYSLERDGLVSRLRVEGKKVERFLPASPGAM